MLSVLVVIFLCVGFQPVQSSHVVGMANFDYISHNRVLWKLGKELTRRGHKYTQILPSCAKETYKDIDVKMFNTSITNEHLEQVLLNLMKLGDLQSISAALELLNFFSDAGLYSLVERFCEDLFKEAALIAELKKTVDLVLCDASNMCCFILAEMMNVSRVDVWPVGFGGAFGSFYLGSPQGAVYLTQETSSEPNHPATFSFTNRLLSYLSSLAFRYAISNYVPVKLWNKYAKANSKHDDAFDALKPHGIVLIPHEFALEYPRPLQVHVKVIGPVLPEPPLDLPDELNKFMTENNQVVLVSFGTTLSNYRPELVQIIADGLSQLSVAVLWKYSGDMPNNIGSNIKIVSWIPQNDILGHPSTKLFVTHCGLNSFLESVYHSVPMVAIPLFGDQHRQATIVKVKGLGVSLDKNVMRSDDLAKAVLEVFLNKQYRYNSEIISAIIKDRKRSPSEEGADWIEYALRHDGAVHLISEAIDLPEYQLYMFDVFLFFLVLLHVVIFMLVYLCCCICRQTKITSKVKQN